MKRPDIRNLFLYRFSAINITFFTLVVAAFYEGWINQIYQADTTHITWIIAFTFLFGLLVSFYRAVRLNRVWNRLAEGSPSLLDWLNGQKPEVIGLRLSANTQLVHHIAVLLLLMGITGTMVGIIVALKSTEALATEGQANMVLAIVMLFKGVYVKFYASLVGITTHMWTLNNYNMLSSMSRRLLARMVEHV